MAAPAERLRVIGLVSGGKDSMWALCETRRLGHAIECLANLRPPPARGGNDGNGDELDSLLVQTVGHACVPAIAACLTPDSGAEGGTPLVRRVTRGRAVCTALGYAPSTPASAAAAAASAAAKDAGDHDAAPSELDEVEDLALLLGECLRRFPRANAVVCGAVLSHYQRLRVEAVCRRLALQPLAWLWGRGQRGLLDDMVRGGVEAVLVKVAAFGLSPAMLGRPVGELRADFARLGDLVGLNECGEGGEYETITLDCPLFETRRVALGFVRVVEARSGGGSGTTAHLAVLECGTEPKAALSRSLRTPLGVAEDVGGKAPPLMAAALQEAQRAGDDIELAAAPEGRVVFASSVVAEPAGVDKPAETLADEARRAFSVLRRRLALAGAAPADVCFVHLYLDDMRSFSEANAAFSKSFLGLHPPARSSVQVRLRGDAPVSAGPRIMLDVVAITGGAAAAAAGRSDVRATLNVGSRSLWAPQCIGPYCQANVLRRQIVLCAGQIGLEPASMQLVPGGARAQLRKSLRNMARVLAACGSALPLALSAVLYVSEAALSPAGDIADLSRCVATWCAGRQLGGAPARAKARARAALADGAEDGSGSEPEESAAADEDGDEAEEDSECEAERLFPLGPAAYCAPRVRAVEAMPPVLVIVVPALPRGALVEVEVAAFTRAAVTEGGGLRALCARGTNAAAASVCVPACAWSCTAAAWRSDADVDGLVAALVEKASQCGLAAARVGGAQLRVRAFLEHGLLPRAAEVETRLSAALGAERGAVSAVCVTRVALSEFVGDDAGSQCGISVIISSFC